MNENNTEYNMIRDNELNADSMPLRRQPLSPRRTAMTLGNGKIVVLPLCESQTFITDGGSTYVAVQVGAVIEQLGLQIEDIIAHVQCEARSTNFDYKIQGQWSFDGKLLENFDADLLGAQTSTGPVIGSAYTDRTDFGRYLRFQIAVKDGGQVEQGVLSVMVVLKLWT